MNRKDHLQWCKDRAIDELEHGGIKEAVASMVSDMGKHEELRDHLGLEQMMTLMICGYNGTVNEMRKFIEGFN